MSRIDPINMNSEAMSLAADHMEALKARQAIEVHNLSRADQTGSKRMDSFVQTKIEIDAASGKERVLPELITRIDFSQGTLRRSENPYHVGLNGPGFFTLQNTQGEQIYSRNGAFKLNAQGQLITSSGSKVMGTGGLIQLNPNNGPIRISPDGRVHEGEAEVAQIAISDTPRPDDLELTADGFRFKAGKADSMTPTQDTEVFQFHLEESNHSTISSLQGLREIHHNSSVILNMIKKDHDAHLSSLNSLNPSNFF